MNGICIGALDIGGTKLAAAVAGADGPLARLSCPTLKSGSSRALPNRAVALLEEACRQAGVDTAALQAVGVSSCGPFLRSGGMVELASPNLCGAGRNSADLPNDWEVIPLEQALRERFERVAVENDAVAALAAERAFGALQGETDCAYVTWSTGVGFGLCVDGHILHGKNGNAGHAGHMLMDENADAVCGCGNRGDLEGMISGRNLGGRHGMSTAQLFDAARSGDAQARQKAADAARCFGRALYNLTAALDIHRFAIGGSVWQHHGDWLLPLVQREIDSRLPVLTRGVRVVPAALGALVADIGAFSLVMPPDWIAHWRATTPWTRLAI